MTDEQPDTIASTPLEARRSVSVVFADLVGSISIAEGRDPEQVHRILARFFEVAAGALEGHGGRVREYLGDAVFATFGHPDVHEDDPLRAIEAGRDLLGGLAGLNDELSATEGLRLHVRIGINTGDVLVGRVAGGHDVMLGDAVNVAQRLAAIGPEDRITVGPGTRASVGAHAPTLEPLGPLDVRGRSAPVEAWVVDAGDGPGRAPVPLVGRSEVLGELRAAFAQASGGRSVAILMRGEPGIGKSRVLSAFLARLDEDTPVLGVACQPAGGRDSLGPMRQLAAALARPRAGVPQPVDPSEPWLGALDAGDRQLVTKRLHALATGGTIPVDEAAWALRRAVGAFAERAPIVVAVDDAHWASPSMLELLGDVAGPDTGGVCLVACARPELPEGGAIAGAGEIELPPLAPGERDELMRVAASPLDPGSRARIGERSRGNPLFLLELARAAVEGTADVASVPPGVVALIAARSAALPLAEQRALRLASVIGPSFDDRELRALGEPEPASTGATLTSRGWWDPDGPGRWAFHHALIRDAAYGSVPKGERADLHERFATWLLRDATSGGPDRGERAGLHLATAHDLLEEIALDRMRSETVGAEGGRLLAEAGRHAVWVAADYGRARELLERARDLVPPDDPERLSLRPMLGAAMAETGDLGLSLSMLRETVELALSADEPHVEAMARFGIVQYHQYSRPPGSVEETGKALERLIPELGRRGDHRTLGCLELIAAVESWRRGQVALTERHQRRAVAEARLAGDEALAARLLGGISIVWAMGPWPLEESIRWHEEVSDRLPASLFGLGMHAVMEPVLLAQRGDLAATEASLDRAHRFADDVRSPFMRFYADENAWTAYQILGRNHRALEFARLSTRRNEFDPVARATAQMSVADSAWRAGELDECRDAVEDYETLGDQTDPSAFATCASLRACLMATDDPRDAERVVAQVRLALDRQEGCDFVIPMADTFLRSAEALAIVGRRDLALDAARRALDTLRMRTPPVLIDRAERAIRALGG